MSVPIHRVLVNNRYIYNKSCQCRYTVYWSGSIIDIYIINHVSADTPCTGQ